MLTSVKCGNPWSHVQIFNGDICVATVRVEYADAVRAAIEAQLAPVANRDQSISTEEK